MKKLQIFALEIIDSGAMCGTSTTISQTRRSFVSISLVQRIDFDLTGNKFQCWHFTILRKEIYSILKNFCNFVVIFYHLPTTMQSILCKLRVNRTTWVVWWCHWMHTQKTWTFSWSILLHRNKKDFSISIFILRIAIFIVLICYLIVLIANINFNVPICWWNRSQLPIFHILQCIKFSYRPPILVE